MSEPIRRYVLTGGLCSGKSTLGAELANRGFYTLPEVGRVIRRYDIHPRRLIHLAAEIETLVPNGVPEVFMDRSPVDTLAFMRTFGKAVEPEHWTLCTRNRYQRVFLLEMLPDYVEDEFRTLPRETSLAIERHLVDLYTELGYEVLRVPVLPVRARADFVLARIASSGDVASR